MREAFPMAIWGYRIQCFDVFAVIGDIICSAIYSWYIGSWLQGMSIGPLMFILGWMTMEWFILGADDYSSSTDRGAAAQTHLEAEGERT
jgi:hypothetical protein